MKLLTKNIQGLRTTFRVVKVTQPFTMEAIVILPDHLHSLLLRWLREKRRCKEGWMAGADRYRNPARTCPPISPVSGRFYDTALNQSLAVEAFRARERQALASALTRR
jgi:hypothetical protein